MLVKQIFHYLVVVITFITMFGAILLLINEFCFFFNDSTLEIFTSIELLFSILFIFLLCFLKFKYNVKFSEFNSNVKVSNWKNYIIIFQLFFFCSLFVIREIFNIISGHSCFLIILSLFYWVVDIGYIWTRSDSMSNDVEK